VRKRYEELSALAKTFARQAHAATSEPVAAELWLIAKEYQAMAAKLADGRLPDIGDPPRWS